jgi:hypothetical protein
MNAVGQYFANVANTVDPGKWCANTRGYGGFYISDGRKTQIGAEPINETDDVLWYVWLIGRGSKTCGRLDKRKCDIRDHASVVKAFEAVINARI